MAVPFAAIGIEDLAAHNMDFVEIHLPIVGLDVSRVPVIPLPLFQPQDLAKHRLLLNLALSMWLAYPVFPLCMLHSFQMGVLSSSTKSKTTPS